MFPTLTLVPRRSLVILAAALLALFAFYVVALDQGQLFALFQGKIALDQNMIHEFVHDARHAAGFPCH